MSPSVRKVWIEIGQGLAKIWFVKSPSVRKVWIEICCILCRCGTSAVTFRKEGVD